MSLKVSQKKCPPGEYRGKSDPRKNQTRCVPCKPGTYTEEENSLSRCLKCFGPCRGYSVETVACNKTTNRKCECPFQYYCATEDVTKCEHCVKCDSGNGPSKVLFFQGSEIHYREACQTCSSGTFRNTTHMHKCQPHTNCTALGMILRYKGNSTSDNLCESETNILQPKISKKLSSTEDNIPFPVQENGRNSNTYYPIEEQNQKQYYQPVMTEARSEIQASSYVHDGKYWLD
ncbi:tumor necrosis factor receptor superfamily member 11B-like [Mobula birostris]|uniref:tumor necrosis factor receptor superfamily member 11B-like n=1 Tax=Mobula birostris TaxID=1983395 RepID=UPI003B281E03